MFVYGERKLLFGFVRLDGARAYTSILSIRSYSHHQRSLFFSPTDCGWVWVFWLHTFPPITTVQQISLFDFKINVNAQLYTKFTSLNIFPLNQSFGWVEKPTKFFSLWNMLSVTSSCTTVYWLKRSGSRCCWFKITDKVGTFWCT